MSVTSSYGLRSIRIASQTNATTITLRNAAQAKPQRWICLDCRIARPERRAIPKATIAGYYQRRHLSRSESLRDETNKPPPPPPPSPTPAAPVANLSPHTTDSHPNDLNAETRDALPSKTDEKRWQASRRMAKLMDSILARASIYGQHINVYTGTDYSGIEALKKKIVDQEDLVRECHKSIDATRNASHEAHEKQDVSQKEIVALLERKSSWTPEELERYMSLVRSEHANEQAVQAKKEDLMAAERDLEDARARLERLERRQYHEEQIWSDTIRRNSTWVTFGLMGVNIVLLLAQIAIFEPYRRKKIVKEVKVALDEMHPASPNAEVNREVERQIDEVVEPRGVPAEQLQPTQEPPQPLDSFVPADAKAQAGKTPLAAGEVLPEEAAQLKQSSPPPSQSNPALPSAYPPTWAGTWDAYKDGFQDLFSERIVQLKKVDVTTTALQGAATGVAAMGILFVLFRPR